MNWLLIALLPPALWSITNHFDKYLLSKYFKGGGVGALMVFSSLIGLFLLPIIGILHPEVLMFTPRSIFIAINGFFYVLAVLPYFYALQKDETSIAVPLFQLIPVFSYILGFFILGETLTTNQLFGGVLIVFGAIGISLDLNSGKGFKLKKDVLLLMTLSSVLFSINFILFKYFAIEADFWFTSFWEYVGFSVFAFLLMIFIKSYRNEFISVVRKNSLAVLSINGINELINIGAKVAFNFASILTPVTLVWIVNGLQPVFVFVYGILLTVFFPKIVKEDIGRKSIIQKILAIVVMSVGMYTLNRQ